MAALIRPLLPSSFLLFFGLFLTSTPIAMVAVFGFGQDRTWWSIANSYGFSIGMCGMYLAPLITTGKHAATQMWIIWITCFTEIFFQVQHNVLVQQLHSHRGTIWEWCFASYGLSDARWSNYNSGTGLEFAVWLINLNDSLLGGIVFLCLILHWQNPDVKERRLCLILATLFRDATLW